MRVLAADADPVGRRLIRNVLDRAQAHELVGEATDLGRALEIAKRERPDVVVLASALVPDVRNDTASFVEDAEAAVILVAVSATGAMIWRAMSAGASGYLLRDRLPGDLNQALAAVEVGGAYLSSPLTRQLVSYLADRWDTERPGDSASDISRVLLPRERETLFRLARGESTEEIAAIMSVTTATVRAYVSRILRKLGVRSRGEAIALAYRSKFYSPLRDGGELPSRR